MADFKQEYLGEFVELSREEKIVRLAWLRYYFNCENYDELVCTGRRHGRAWPVSFEERHFISQFSGKAARVALRLSDASGFDRTRINQIRTDTARDVLQMSSDEVSDEIDALARELKL